MLQHVPPRGGSKADPGQTSDTEELEEELSEEREVLASLLRLLPHDPVPDKDKED